MITRNPEVLVQITKIDTLLQTSGVTSYCLECIKSPRGGCCQGCKSLGTEGCTNKPLSCALWLCHRAAQEFPKVTEQLGSIARQYPPLVVHGFRENSILKEMELL